MENHLKKIYIERYIYINIKDMCKKNIYIYRNHFAALQKLT